MSSDAYSARPYYGVFTINLVARNEYKSDLDALSALDLTPLDTPEPELAYIFKHILTQEVAYETLSFATRAIVHDQIGQYIEKNYQEVLDQYIDLLAYHFERSENRSKKSEYLLKAAEAAQTNYANAAAITYYQRVLHLLPEEQRVVGLLKLGQVLELVGEWENAEADQSRG